MDWTQIWTLMQGEHRRLNDARSVFDAAYADEKARSSLAAAQAAVEFARDLCRFMTTFERRGVFEALLQSPQSQSEARDQLVHDLGECLRVEAVLLERAGLNPGEVRALIDDVRAIARPPYPILAADLWQKHVDAAIGAACNFPGSAVLLKATNGWDYVQGVRKKYQWVGAAVIGTANILTAAHDPTLLAAAKVSKYLATLLAIGHQGHAEGPGVPT